MLTSLIELFENQMKWFKFDNIIKLLVENVGLLCNNKKIINLFIEYESIDALIGWLLIIKIE